MKAKISEIFRSIQGEGPYMGVEQIFVRFYGCDFGCSFCDTSLKNYKNHTTISLLAELEKYDLNCHSISITGGEPLLQSDFLFDFLPVLKNFLKQKNSIAKIYLETNGILFKQLESVLDFVDIISMDIKLPSSTNKNECWAEHEKFLETARQKEVFVKIVVTDKTKTDDVVKAAELVGRIDNDVEFILQPVSAHKELLDPDCDKMLCFKEAAEKVLRRNIKIVGQMHKVLGIK